MNAEETEVGRVRRRLRRRGPRTATWPTCQACRAARRIALVAEHLKKPLKDQRGVMARSGRRKAVGSTLTLVVNHR